MIRRILFLYLCALVPLQAELAAIHGLVADPSGRPVEGAKVLCKTQVVYTNIDGRFNSAGDDCDAEIAKAGFVTAHLHLTAGEEARLTLGIAGPVETVLVSATRAQTTPEQAAVSANVLTERSFSARDYPVIPDLLRELPGMEVIASGGRGAVTSLFTRGSDSTATLILLDGVPLNDPGGQINLAHLSSIGIDRLEVVRGPESALFGAEAAAGVVQIFTKRGDAESTRPHGYLSYERGNFQTDRWTANVNGGFLKRVDYSLAAEQLHTAGEFPNSFYRNDTGSANLGYRISDRTELRAVLRIYDAHLGTPGQVAYQAEDLVANEETRDSSISVRVNDSRGAKFFQTAAFTYHRLRDIFNENESYSSQNLAALVRDVPDGHFTDTYFVSLLNPAALPSPAQIPAGTRLATATAYFGPYGSLNRTERDSADYQGTVAQSGGALVFGYGFQRQGGNLSGLDVSRDHHGLFVNEQYTLFERLYLNAGARVEHSTAFGTEFVPRGGVGYQLFREHGISSSTVLRASAGRGITEPSLYENYIQSPYAVGNPKLQPAKTNSYEAGAVNEWFGRRLRTEVVAFRSSFRDLITYVYPSWQNINRSWARGLEFSAEARLFPNVLLTGSYTRLYTRITESVSPVGSLTGVGEALLRRPRNAGSVVLSVTPRRWAFVMGAKMLGDRLDSDYLFGVNRNPGFDNVYVSASYQFARHFTPTLRLDNLLNERYEEVLGYTALSRTVVGGLRITW